jgi:signal transduction histidine kinase
MPKFLRVSDEIEDCLKTVFKIHWGFACNGPGISPDKYDMVLERFQKSPNNNKSGSGLGLAIVKRICDLHHARLMLDQATKKGGLKVTVAFSR